ncbi:hypothetical protein Lfu02_43620 [Longispora fulva]|nr:hypothetical protein Lfu02_43620 [Longispora fulva]
MTFEVSIPDLGRAGLLRVPDGPVLAGMVALHPANDPGRDQPTFEHLAATVVPLGYAVLSYDRRADPDGGDVPFALQAADALAALRWLSDHQGVPVGLWAFSQGTWVAGLVAAESDLVSFLALLGCPGVSPATQMRFHTDELLRRAGHDATARAEALALRAALEDLIRGDLDRERAAALLDAHRDRPWFPLTYLPDDVPVGLPAWTDMDHDPAPVYARVTCPVLLVYGAEENCVPVAASVGVWRRAAEAAGNADLTIVEVPGMGHWPAEGNRRDVAGISPDYTRALADWFART